MRIVGGFVQRAGSVPPGGIFTELKAKLHTHTGILGSFQLSEDLSDPTFGTDRTRGDGRRACLFALVTVLIRKVSKFENHWPNFNRRS